jgi:GNAT superfamily N-acetyltransferase
MDLKSYTLEELEPYLLPLFSNPDSILPVSPLRLRSYLENPRAEPYDPVLFEIHHDGKLVAYRTLLPDCFYNDKGDPVRFAWLSGNWVTPLMRRQGLSTRLLEMAEEKWQGRLMYTNYAPESKALYDGTGRFMVIANREGKRFYLRSATEELLGNRVGSTQLLQTGDRFINRIRERSIRKFPFPEQVVQCLVEQVGGFDKKSGELADRFSKFSLFRRDSEIFRWALENPWVSSSAGDPVRYQFSYRARRFENRLYHMTQPGENSNGFLWLLLHNNVLSVPYLFAGSGELYPCMTELIIKTMIDEGITHTTIRYKDLMKQMMVHKKIFLSVRKMPQLIFAHKNLAGLLPEEPLIHDGDGDVMFSG